MLRTNLGRLRLIGILEAISFLLVLGIGMPLKYLYDMPMPNKIIGMAHGFLFIGYLGMIFIVREQQKWPMSYLLWGVVASIVPFGPFVADAYLFREKKDQVAD